ncbi:MAG: OmpA family protein [Halioglobus sp.]
MKLHRVLLQAKKSTGIGLLPFGLVISLAAFPVRGEDVFLIQERPDPAALAQILFPVQQTNVQRPAKFKLRGIRFTDEISNDADSAVAEPAETEKGGTAVGFNIQFALNSPELAPQTLPFLDAVGEMLMLEETRHSKLTVAGHADASGDAAHNLALSQARATAVVNYIQNHFDVASDRLSTRGYGEYSPLPNSDPYDAVNRRVEFHPAQ